MAMGVPSGSTTSFRVLWQDEAREKEEKGKRKIVMSVSYDPSNRGGMANDVRPEHVKHGRISVDVFESALIKFM